MTRFFITFIFLCFHFVVVAQNQYVRPLVEHAGEFNRVLPQETVYLHFDNTGYFVGEKIWFKAYVVSSAADSLSRKSGVLYVELVDPLGSLVDTRILQLKDGQGHGEFRIFSHLMGGFYEVRAYTRYMLNFSPECVFSRVFPVFEKPKEAGDYSRQVLNLTSREMMRASKRGSGTEENERVNVAVYPEGGHLVQGKRCRVAFDVYDRKGMHNSADCALLQGKDTVLTVSCDSMGRGTFELVPDTVPYRLVARVDGHRGETALPTAISSGCGLRVDAGSEQTHIAVMPSENLKGMKLGVAVSHHGQMEVCDSLVVDGKDFTTTLSNEALADGVNSVTVFSTSGTILAERMFFVYPRKRIQPIGIKVESLTLAPYDTVTIAAHTKMPNTTFSIAVRDADTQVQGSSTDAATWLLLASDLKGYIEHAERYLEADDEVHRRATDLLMMVQGWRRYDFETMNGLRPLQLTQPAEQKRLLMGQLHPRRKDDPVGGVDLNVVLLHKHDVLKGTSVTDENGYYTFEMPDCWGNWHMIMRTSIEEKNKNYYVGVSRNFSPRMRAYSPYEMVELPPDKPRFWMAMGESNLPRRWKDSRMLKEVTVKARRRERVGWASESFGAWRAQLMYNCVPAADYYADQGLVSPTLYDWLKEQNPLFAGNDNISGESSFRRKLYNFHDDGPSYDNRPILWILDNKFMFGTSMSPRMVQTPKRSEQNNLDTQVFPSSVDECQTVYISTDGGNLRHYAKELGLDAGTYVGVFVYTRNQQYHNYKGLRRTYFDGFSLPETFQHNNYRLMPPEPDFRRTLYWNPDVKTDAQGNAKVGFYNNSTCRQFIVSAEGVTQNGTVLIYK